MRIITASCASTITTDCATRIWNGSRATPPGSTTSSPPNEGGRLVSPRIAPSVLESDLSHRFTREGPEILQRPADRHQREGRHVVRDAEQVLEVGLAAQVVGGQHRSEPE